MTEALSKIFYERHPVTPERKAELRGHGFQIIDAAFKPEGHENPGEGEPDPADANGDGKVSVAELRAALVAKGIDIPAGAKKADLQALLDA